MKKTLLVLSALNALTLSGCSILNTGEEHFACSGMPNSVHCASARTTYEITNDNTVPSLRYGKEVTQQSTTHRAKTKNVVIDSSGKVKSFSPQADELISIYVTPNIANSTIPISTPAQVMRIWIAPYVDVQGDFNSAAYVYTDVEPRKWVVAPPNATDQGGQKNQTPLLARNTSFFGNGSDYLSKPTQKGTIDTLKLYQEQRKHE